MISQQQTFISFTHKMAAKTRWHRYETKLRQFHPVYILLITENCQSIQHVAANDLHRICYACNCFVRLLRQRCSNQRRTLIGISIFVCVSRGAVSALALCPLRKWRKCTPESTDPAPSQSQTVLSPFLLRPILKHGMCVHSAETRSVELRACVNVT